MEKALYKLSSECGAGDSKAIDRNYSQVLYEARLLKLEIAKHNEMTINLDGIDRMSNGE